MPDIIRKVLDVEIKEIDEISRSFLAVASTEVEGDDREGDTVHIFKTDKGKGLWWPRGDQTPLIVGHNYYSWPVGTARNLKKEKSENGGRLTFRPTFFPPEILEEAETAWKISQTGVLSFSIGFWPDKKKMEPKEGRGYHFYESEGLEVSLTPVPANRAAVPLFDSKALTQMLGEEGWAKVADAILEKIKGNPVNVQANLLLEAIRGLKSEDHKDLDIKMIDDLLTSLKDAGHLAWWHQNLDETEG